MIITETCSLQPSSLCSIVGFLQLIHQNMTNNWRENYQLYSKHTMSGKQYPDEAETFLQK